MTNVIDTIVVQNLLASSIVFFIKTLMEFSLLDCLNKLIQISVISVIKAKQKQNKKISTGQQYLGIFKKANRSNRLTIAISIAPLMLCC